MSSEPFNQAWLASHGLWALVAHAFSPETEDSGRLASAILANLASNAANKPLMYKAELRLDPHPHPHPHPSPSPTPHPHPHPNPDLNPDPNQAPSAARASLPSAECGAGWGCGCSLAWA